MFQGANLKRGARIVDYRIYVGQEMATVTELLPDYLTFVPPDSEPEDEGLHSQDGGKRVLVSNSVCLLGLPDVCAPRL